MTFELRHTRSVPITRHKWKGRASLVVGHNMVRSLEAQEHIIWIIFCHQSADCLGGHDGNDPGKASWQEITKTLPDSIVRLEGNREAKTFTQEGIIIGIIL